MEYYPVIPETLPEFNHRDDTRRPTDNIIKDSELENALKNKIKNKINKLNLNELKMIDNKINELFRNKFEKAKENIEVLYKADIKDPNRSTFINKNNKFCEVKIFNKKPEKDDPEKINFIKNACKKFIEDYENKIKNTK